MRCRFSDLLSDVWLRVSLSVTSAVFSWHLCRCDVLCYSSSNSKNVTQTVGSSWEPACHPNHQLQYAWWDGARPSPDSAYPPAASGSSLILAQKMQCSASGTLTPHNLDRKDQKRVIRIIKCCHAYINASLSRYFYG